VAQLCLHTCRRVLDAPDTQTLQGVRDKAIMEVFYSTGIGSAAAPERAYLADAIISEQLLVVTGPAIGAIHGNDVLEPSLPERQTVEDVLAEQQHLVNLGGAPVPDATTLGGQIQVLRLFHSNPPPIDPVHHTQGVKDRHGDTTPKVLLAASVFTLWGCFLKVMRES